MNQSRPRESRHNFRRAWAIEICLFAEAKIVRLECSLSRKEGKKMKNKNVLFIAGLMILMVSGMGCQKSSSERLIAPASITEEVMSIVLYSGSESEEEVLADIAITEKATGYLFSVEQKEQMLKDFRSFQESTLSKSSAQTQAIVTAYTCHYVYSGDKDLYLEYKWWDGYRHAYSFQTPNWTLYWLIKVCYGGQLTSWTWMEGGYQRVTAIVGSCVYVPLGASFVQSYLWVVWN
ncbi:MAG: hypothetical protein ABIH38_00960 [Patescibacteria group bacterium]